jgi:hypothetical protein
VDFCGTPRITRELISRRHVTETDLLTPWSPRAVTQSLATQVGMPAATEHLGCSRLTAAQEVAAQEDGMVVQSPPEESPSPPIALDLHGGDAWAWQKTLSGYCPGCPPGATIELLVNGASVPAERKGDTGTFSGVATLDPGDNEVLAVVRMPDGGEVRSVPVTYTVRLEPRPNARLTARTDGGRVVFDGTASTPSEYDGAAIKLWSGSPTETAARRRQDGKDVPITPSPDHPNTLVDRNMV